MGQTKRMYGDIKKGLKGCVKVGTLPYRILPSPAESITDTWNYIKKPPNPIRRTLRFGGVALVTPVVVPLFLVPYVAYPALGTVLAVGCIAGGTAGMALTALWDGMTWVYDRTDDLISQFDEVPNTPSIPILDTIKADSHTVILRKLNVNEIKGSHKLTPYTDSYVQSFDQKIPYSEQIKNLQLTNTEQSTFAEYRDPITEEIMDIPVKLNDHIYDLRTILECFEKNGKDPLNSIPFELSHISADRSTSEKIQDLIKHIQKERTVAENEMDEIPEGGIRYQM